MTLVEPDVLAVLFDLDGTLFDHRAAADAGCWDWASGLPGWRLSREATVERWRGLEKTYFGLFDAGRISFDGQRRARARGMLDADLTDEQADEAFAGFLAAYEAHWEPFGDADPSVSPFERAGYDVAVLTNGPPGLQQAKLDAIGLGRLRLFAVTDPSHIKPAPTAYARAASELRLAPDQVLLVGDDEHNDYRAAIAAGMRAVHLDRSGATPGAITSLAQLRPADPARQRARSSRC